MTESLPAHPASPAGAKRPTSVSPRDRAMNAASEATLRAVPRIPDRLKRLMMGGRTVTIDGNTLDTTLQLVLNLQRFSGNEGLILSEDVATARTQLNIVAAQFPRVKADVTSTDVSLPGPAGKIRARHYRSNEDGAPLLVYYHGGGFVVGGVDTTHDNLCEVICDDAGVHVLSVDYRLAPEHKTPAAVDDAYAGYRWALEHAAELGADPGRVAVGGDSAGGNLATVVSHRARDEGERPPALQLLLYPITNFAGQTRSHGLFADGFFLRGWDMDFCQRQVHRGFGRRPHRSAGVAAAGRRPVRATADPSGHGGLRPAARRGPPVRRGAARRRQLGGRPGVRFADARLRQLHRPRWRQRDGDRRGDVGVACPSQPQLTNRGRPAGTLDPWPNPRRTPATT